MKTMKKILIATVAVLTAVSCNVKTPEEKAKEDFQKSMQKMDEEKKLYKIHLQQLYNTATKEYYSKSQRYKALQELENETAKYNKEYIFDFDAMRKAIQNNTNYNEQ